MNRRLLLAALAATAVSSVTSAAFAREPADDIGTMPAAKSAPEPANTKKADVERVGGYGEVEVDDPPPPVAVNPPSDWAVLHAGLRPRIGTFGGIATLALAHARTERFYGVLSLSLVRSDAGTHVGLTQFSIGRSVSGTLCRYR